MAGAGLTVLNSMAGRNFERALEQHLIWGLSALDLKDCVLDKRVTDLRDFELEQVAAMTEDRDLTVYCLSTNLFDDEVENGEAAFAERHLKPVERVIRIAEVLDPNLVRLIAPRSARRDETPDGVAYLKKMHDWVIPQYIEAVERIYEAGFRVTIENEARGSLLANAEEVLGFFDALGFSGEVCFTWDVQNMWQMGTYPTEDVYEQLKPVIGYVHLKGGQSEPDSKALKWKTSLADASWPLVEITSRVVADGVSPVICLNPSHGEEKPGYDYRNLVQRDIEFIRQVIPDIR